MYSHALHEYGCIHKYVCIHTLRHDELLPQPLQFYVLLFQQVPVPCSAAARSQLYVNRSCEAPERIIPKVVWSDLAIIKFGGGVRTYSEMQTGLSLLS